MRLDYFPEKLVDCTLLTPELIEEGCLKYQTLGINGRRCLNTNLPLIFFSPITTGTQPIEEGRAEVMLKRELFICVNLQCVKFFM